MVELQVFANQGVPAGARRPIARALGLTTAILCLRDSLKMPWIRTGWVAAQMIKNEAGRDRTNEMLVEQSMRAPAAPVQGDGDVAARLGHQGNNPTLVRLADERRGAFRYGYWTHDEISQNYKGGAS